MLSTGFVNAVPVVFCVYGFMFGDGTETSGNIDKEIKWGRENA